MDHRPQHAGLRAGNVLVGARSSDIDLEGLPNVDFDRIHTWNWTSKSDLIARKTFIKLAAISPRR